jgi:hypothetical protein
MFFSLSSLLTCQKKRRSKCTSLFFIKRAREKSSMASTFSHSILCVRRQVANGDVQNAKHFMAINVVTQASIMSSIRRKSNNE